MTGHRPLTSTERAWMALHHRTMRRLDWYRVAEIIIVGGAFGLLMLFLVGVRP